MYAIIFLAVSLLLCGCSSVPTNSSYAFSEQQKMQAAHHWDVLASDVANQINNQLIRSDYVDKSVFVQATCGDDATPCEQGETTVFNEGFRDLLITRLVGFGVPTSSSLQPADIEVNYKVQVIYHQKSLYTMKPGLLTVLATGISVLRHTPGEIQTIAAAAALDFLNAAGSTAGHYEVIISTSMVTENKYLFRTSDIYYITDPDFWHYQNTSPGETIQLVSTRGDVH